MDLDFLLYLAMIPALGLAAQWVAWRTDMPGILLLLVFGMVLGQFIRPDQLIAELTGGEESAAPRILFPLVSLAVAVIMFEGGLSLKLSELRTSGDAALRLCIFGMLITFTGSMLASHYVLGYAWKLSCLLGAILVVTGPTVIGPLLRQVRPSRRVANTLKWEGIVIDPIGAILAILVFENLLLSPDEFVLGSAVLMLAKTVMVGLILGIGGGILLTQAFRRFLVPDNLHGVFALSIGLLLFAISDHFAHESGLITVTVLGIWLTNQHGVDIEHVIEFKENLRTLLIGCLFIVLGSRINFADVIAIGWPGVAFVVVLIIVVRPVSVFVALLGNALSIREKAFIAGMAPRGIVAAAVSSVFALKLEQLTDRLDLSGAEQMVTVTFCVIVGTVAVYGLAAMPLARWLHLAEEKTSGVLIAGADAWIRDFAKELQNVGLTVVLIDTNYNKISQARVAGLEGVCANILNEHVRDELPLSGIGNMMAMTLNDEVNALAVRECRALFDRKHLFQLSFNTQNQHFRRGLTKNLMGRELFARGLTSAKLMELHHSGAKFKRTNITDEFSYQDFLRRYRESSILMCVLDADGSLILNTVDDPVTPKVGQSIIAMVTVAAVPEGHPAVAKQNDQADLADD